MSLLVLKFHILQLVIITTLLQKHCPHAQFTPQHSPQSTAKKPKANLNCYTASPKNTRKTTIPHEMAQLKRHRTEKSGQIQGKRESDREKRRDKFTLRHCRQGGGKKTQQSKGWKLTQTKFQDARSRLKSDEAAQTTWSH